MSFSWWNSMSSNKSYLWWIEKSFNFFNTLVFKTDWPEYLSLSTRGEEVCVWKFNCLLLWLKLG